MLFQHGNDRWKKPKKEETALVADRWKPRGKDRGVCARERYEREV
jgi:hypothetical protein